MRKAAKLIENKTAEQFCFFHLQARAQAKLGFACK
jgi:hypothetical protein